MLLQPVAAQPDPATDLVSDRPDFTESPVVVPRGLVQLEGGASIESIDSADRVSVGELLLRIPIASRLEIRAGFPSYAANGSDGFTDASIGGKLHLGEHPAGWQLGLIARLSLPTGAEALSGSSADPSAILTAGRAISDRVNLGGQVQVDVPDMDGRRVDLGGTIVASSQVGRRSDAFIEIAAFAPDVGDPAGLVHTGLTFGPHADLQFDVHGGAGIFGDAADVFAGVGFVVRR